MLVLVPALEELSETLVALSSVETTSRPSLHSVPQTPELALSVDLETPKLPLPQTHSELRLLLHLLSAAAQIHSSKEQVPSAALVAQIKPRIRLKTKDCSAAAVASVRAPSSRQLALAS
jgi:hypothetical protein